ncbi:DNA topoisomerase IV [Mariniflexile ostreae]|uniref:DNA topoisomerase IV n=1 Tax=Mariniflexile ostreae TaxID=1520892 RepID=A0ABV5FDZ2_9FLAO
MKKGIVALSLFGLFNCYQSERHCVDYKTGSFYSEITIDNVVYRSTFKRTDTLQVEVYNKKIDSSKLRWINDCEVVFKTINPKSMNDKKDIHLKILTTTDSSYTFEYSYVGEVIKQKGIAYKAD